VVSTHFFNFFSGVFSPYFSGVSAVAVAMRLSI
jgi:hypothetical protein